MKQGTMSMQYPSVFEAFHADPGVEHAHGSIDNPNGHEYHAKNGSVDDSINATPKMKLYDSSNNHVGTYDGTEWQKANLADITTFDDLEYTMTNDVAFDFGLKNTLKNKFNSSTYDEFFHTSVNDFLKATHSVKDASEIKSVNSYVNTLQEDELARLMRLNDKFRNNVLTTKQMYMMVNRDAHRIRSNIRIIMYAMVFAAIIMALMPSHQTTWAKVLMALAILLFFTYTVLHVRKDNSRRFKDFDKFFFKKGDLPDSNAKETETTDEDEDEDANEGGGSCQS